MTFIRSLSVLFCLGALAVLAGCASQSSSPESSREYKHKHDHAPSAPIDVSQVPDAVPKIEQRTRAGNPPVYKVLGKTYKVLETEKGYSNTGIASWYGNKFHGEKTSNGEIYDMYVMSAAHKTLPIPSYVRVTNLDNNKQVVVRVNDRGPFHEGRIIDLSYAAASKLGYLSRGTARVRVEAIVPEPVQSQNSAATDLYHLPPNTFLQVGAFSQLASANSLVNSVSSVTDFPVLVRSAENLYRVRIGPVATNQELEALRQQLLKKNISAPHVVYE